MNHNRIAGAAFATLFCCAATAESIDSPLGTFDVSMTATLASDYIWRGQSQTGGAAAIQGSLDIAHESGLYIGAWASNVDDEAFPGNSGGADIEVDYYAGYAGSITEDISYDLAWATYTYPQASIFNTDEVLASITAYGVTLGAKYAYDPDSKLYTYIAYERELAYGLGLLLSYGVTDTKDQLNGPDDRDEKYRDWSVGLTKTLAGLNFALIYTDTDIKGSTCEAWYGDKDHCDSNLTLSVSKTF
ncbi:TorF family putative porin [Zestomonas thermotolerans]|jgi:uncharacterized protein (TIGR02001 family)|uniref:TorF family putative porin n=1 Tax=Zestomonas thermotolerans TaxID=157784 RepID=UPI0004B81252|nr:TorF family putative porin [Pseudomonas thermotolerans]